MGAPGVSHARGALVGMLALVALAATVAAEPAASGSSYYLKLWGCSSDDPSKPAYKNQRFILNSAAHTINFAATNGCLTSSSSRKAAPGSQLHVSPCTPACSPEQGWLFDASTGYLKSTAMDGVCVGVASQSDPEAEVVVTAQRCDANNVDLKWQYDAALGHFMMNGQCIDAGSGLVSKPGVALASGRVPPSGQGCLTSVAKALPYCDTSLPIASRVADIISRMTIAEKTAHLWGSGSHADNTTFPGVPRIGLPPFDWGLEGLHGLRIGCYPVADTKTCVDPNFPASGTFACPTVFPAPTGLGATFNDTLIHEIGVVIGTEARALNNMGTQAAGRLIVRTPELNLIRDPRWGRNVENPTEDPMHAGKYGAAMVNGVQSKVDGVMLAGVEMKHYAVYQVEDCGAVPQGHGPGIPTGLPSCSRMKFDANISAAELNESYLPAFRHTVQTSDPTGVMCSYNAVNGAPACANKLLADTIRGWGFTGYTGTDCSAADGIFDNHNYAEDTAHGYAVGLNSGGYDLICNPHNFTALTEAVSNQLVTSAALDRALTNAFTVLMKVGMFSPLESSAVFEIGIDKLGSPAHMDLALQAARQSTVLLRNVKKQGRAALPLDQPKNGTRIAIIGPQANATGQLGGNYFNSECASGSVVWTVAAGGGGQLSSWPCVPTLAQAVKAVAGAAATVTYSKGCEQRCSGRDSGGANVSKKMSEYAPNVCNAADRAGIPSAVAAAGDAEIVILGLGFDTVIAGEGHDRLDMALPGAQEELALSVLRAVSPKTTVVLVLYAGASISIDALLEAARQPDAIIVGHMPGVTGGTAVAEALFGKHNDFGRLPYTVYPHSYQNTTQFTEMSLRVGQHTPQGRTHRFFTGTPQFKYGEGMSFTEFALSDVLRADGDNTVSQAEPDHVLRAEDTSAEIMIAVSLQNIGAERAGSTVVMAWFAPAAEATGVNHRDSLAARLGQDPPIRSLVAYTRTRSLTVGEAAVVELKVRVDDLAFVDARTSQRVLPAGEYELRVDLGPSATSAVVRSVRVASDVLL